MKGVKLGRHIYFLANEEGIGIMFMYGGKHRRHVSIEDQNDFKFWLKQFRLLEDKSHFDWR